MRKVTSRGDQTLTLVVLETITDRVFAALDVKAQDRFVGGRLDVVLRKLKGDPARKTFQGAVGLAIDRYGQTSGVHFELSQTLLEREGPLTKRDVATELSKIVAFDGDPDVSLIAARWAAAVGDPPADCDFGQEASFLLGNLRDALRETDFFGPIFDAHSFDAILSAEEESSGSLADIADRLEELQALFAAPYAGMIHAFNRAPLTIRDRIRDDAPRIRDLTREFVGRQFVFDAVEAFLGREPSGYFFLRGEPGIGKSAIAAELVMRGGCVHHFNSRAVGVNTAAAFLENVCAQIVTKYGLRHDLLPPNATQDAGFLGQLLEEVSRGLHDGEHAVIVVDALDEVDRHAALPGTNPLLLPVTLPAKVYILVTMRKARLDLRFDGHPGELEVEAGGKNNIEDIRSYVARALGRPELRQYADSHGMAAATFVDALEAKSEGNFMYLRYVLPEIARGAYQTLDIDEIPDGLQRYYQDHWSRMRGQSEDAWFTYKLPIIMALSLARKPVSVDLIADFSGVREKARIRAVLEEWGPFLRDSVVEANGRTERRYSVYHSSFLDFIAEKEEVIDERVSRENAVKRIQDSLFRDFFDET